MNELCIDASVALKLVFKGESHRITARRLVHQSIANNVMLIAPPLFGSEVDTAVRKRVHKRKLSVAEEKKALAEN